METEFIDFEEMKHVYGIKSTFFAQKEIKRNMPSQWMSLVAQEATYYMQIVPDGKRF